MKNAQQLILAYAQSPWRKQTQFIGLFLLVLVLIALVASLYLVVSAQAATYGREIQGMQIQIKEYQRNNADLQAELAQLTSATIMEARADELGLQPALPEQILYLEVAGYIPRQPANLAPPVEPAAAPIPGINPEFNQPLFDWLEKQVIGVDLKTWIVEATRR
jgi:cell division protein FtsL